MMTRSEWFLTAGCGGQSDRVPTPANGDTWLAIE